MHRAENQDALQLAAERLFRSLWEEGMLFTKHLTHCVDDRHSMRSRFSQLPKPIS